VRGMIAEIHFDTEELDNGQIFVSDRPGHGA
jgi:hypothetical protein